MRFAGAFIATCLAVSPASAQETFLGKTISILVGFGAGQAADMSANSDAFDTAAQRLTAEPTYDQAARFYAAHLGRFLPGNPKVEFRLVPGAASIVAARQLVERASADGTLVAMLGPAAVFAPIAGNAGNFDPRALVWLGARQRDDDVCIARAGGPVQSLEDLTRREAFVATLTPGSKTSVYPRALNALAGAKLKIISGYASAFEVTRALETKETDVWCGWTINSLRYRHPEMLRDGKVRLLVQFSRASAENRMQIPLASELPESPDARAAMLALERQTRFGAFALATSARTEPARQALLRTAFAAMLGDPEVLADAARQRLEIDPVPGEELQGEANAVQGLSPAARELLRAILRGQ